jgi:aspartyl-tRNA(Asn)/glutamyl-tRNA(Gln) amidotransferase subunit B
MAAYEPVIGLECHVQLQTRSKAFSAANASFGGSPNDYTDPYTLALPGTLPVLNTRAVEFAIRMALATGSTLRKTSRFARKHYFYPDLPKGYQISQYDEPLAEHGEVSFFSGGSLRKVRLIRIHMEEDAGKSMHVAGAHGPVSLVDLNRAGVPLIEVVSAPDLRSAEEAAEYLKALRQLVRYLGICDGNMEEGSLRCDANVSVRPVGATTLGTRTELKNINSFRNVQRAIEYEIERQIDLVERGGQVVQETRLWDADRGSSHAMRSKEEAHDYRYFPEPDLPPLALDAAWIERVHGELPELPLARRARFMEKLGLTEYDAALLTAEKDVADYYEAVVAAGADAKRAANWVGSELLRELNRDGRTLSACPIAPAALAELTRLVDQGTISGKIAKDVFGKMWATGQGAQAIVEAEGLVQVTDEAAIEAVVRKVVEANPQQVEKYRKGNEKLLGFFVGQVMRETAGKASPELVNQLLRRILSPKEGSS